MDGLTLIAEARAAGLSVAAQGGRLVLRGPRRAGAMARRLLEHKADVMAALARDRTPTEAERPEQQPPNPEKLADAIAKLVMRLRDRGKLIQEVVLTATADRPEPEPTSLADILLPPSWLTARQRRLWRQRAAFYRSTGLSQDDAEQEAMAELICTGKLCNPDAAFPWPK